MRCTLVFYLVTTIFVVVYSSLPELCVFKGEKNSKKIALCGRDDVKHTFDFIPPVYQNIKEIRIWKQPLKQLPYNAFRNLSSQSSVSDITVSNCQISHVDAGALLNLHNLTYIYLGRNDITEIDSKLFSDTKRIKYIFMEYNKIEVLPNGIFQNLTHLKTVLLNDNRIRQVDWISFKNTPSLQIIDLANNQIEFMNVLSKDKIDNLTSLWLADNPWKCDCELGPLYDLLIKINFLYQTRLVCEKPPRLQGRMWKDISRDEFVCPSEDVISTQDSVMTSTEPMTSTEQADNIPVTVHSARTAATIVKRRSVRRTNVRKMDRDLSMRVV